MRFSVVDLYTMLHSSHCAKLPKFVTNPLRYFFCNINHIDVFSTPRPAIVTNWPWLRSLPRRAIRTELSTGLETALSCGFGVELADACAGAFGVRAAPSTIACDFRNPSA